ncbi:AfsR/SARP family transcriptional regulator [Nonomuraea typhae]|uniref:AfsR/SARP family transcriptional regulator n=1 Tax=Nonomuraea typhae TaxID=2603600 RepID=UPI0012FC3214|nr:bacterial transcriptional activator domain-containing protein [Nonomuraea typhae]
MFGLLVMVLAVALIAQVRSRLRSAGVGPTAGDGLLRGGRSERATSQVGLTAGACAPAVVPGEVSTAGDLASLKTDAPAPAQGGEGPQAPTPAADAAIEAASLAPVASGFVAAPGKAKVEVFGVPRMAWAGKEVVFGRAEARDVFALLSISADGVPAEAIVETLWPGDGERGGRRLESAVREINQAMRQASGCASGVRFVMKSGERRLLPAAWFDADFWRFGEAYQRASTAADDVTRTAALHEALALYRGPLLEGSDDLWVLPIRQAAQRQAVDAAERLAELVRADDQGRALDVLRLAVERIDPYDEMLWCELMTIQAELGRLPAVRRSFELLKARLAEIDAVPSAQARQVYERLLR